MFNNIHVILLKYIGQFLSVYVIGYAYHKQCENIWKQVVQRRVN